MSEVKNEKILLFSILALVLFISSCGNHVNDSSEDKRLKNELVLAIGGETDDGFDPTTGWGMYGSPLFQSTLFKYNQDFELENDLATDLNVSEDGLTYTVTIRDDVEFSDETPLTAKDVVFTFETAKESGSVVDLSNLEEIKALDETNVEFKLKAPASTFLTQLTTMGIVPEHAYDGDYNQKPIGSGPYQLTEWERDQQLIVEANPNYYGKTPPFKKLTFLFLDEDVAFAAAKSHEADIVAITPSFADTKVEGMKQIDLETVDNRGIVFPYVPEGEEREDGAPIGNDVTSDEAIRHAIDMAVDRQALVEGVLEGFGTKAFSVADGMPWWNEETEIEDNQIDQAKEALESAGWQENDQGIREKSGLKAAFDLYYPAGDEIRQSLALAVQDQLKLLGIEVDVKSASWNDLEKVMYANPVVMGWGSQDPLEMYNIYSGKTRGEGFYNTNYYQNDKVDDYMTKAMQASTTEEANDYWKKAQWDGQTGFSAKGDAPWVWLVNLKHIYLVDEDLNIGKQKIQPHGHGWPVTDFIEDWTWEE